MRCRYRGFRCGNGIWLCQPGKQQCADGQASDTVDPAPVLPADAAVPLDYPLPAFQSSGDAISTPYQRSHGAGGW
jgi:hypothetical protein